MAEQQSARISREDPVPSSLISGEEFWLRPWLFQAHDLTQALEVVKTVDKEALTNKLNHINFTRRSILVHLRHSKYEEGLLLRAYPDPCLGKRITCRWRNDYLPVLNPVNYQLLDLVIDDGRSLILVPVTLQEVHRDGFTIQLPRTSYALGQRKTRRHVCREVTAELIQSGFQAHGKLLDFSPVGFRIRVYPVPSCSFHWFDSDELVTIHLRGSQQILFSGPCRCIRAQGGVQEREIVLEPILEKIKRFKKKPIRNIRQHLVPTPTVTFDHPLFKKRVELEVFDISTSGFSVHEEPTESVLMPGMIIPELKINYAGSLRMTCLAQVVYRLEDKREGIRSGLAILDMDIKEYSRLAHILTQAVDSQAHISSEADLDGLWEFFFETGFLYPKKYRLIESYRETFKETYRRLYQENPEIAGHFTYRKNGRIYGHISMVRVYEQAWMIHHHAARTIDNKQAGLVVLRQIMRHLNDMCRMPSSKMDYVMSYFRPENKFPNRVFGGFAKALKIPQGCSMDLFCYLPYTTLSLRPQLPPAWSLKESSASEIWELNLFYNHYSGGLLLRALGLVQEKDSGNESLEEIYSSLGFLRKWRAYCLTQEGKLNAVLIVNQANLGLNLSELLNSIMILVTNPKGLPWSVLSTAVGQLIGRHHLKRVPVLFYPFEYVKAKDVPYEKQYHLWILNVQYGSEYLEYMQRKFRVN